MIPDSGSRRVEDNKLIFEAAQPKEDSGNYSCVAENLASVQTEFVIVVVSCEYSNYNVNYLLIVKHDVFFILAYSFFSAAPTIIKDPVPTSVDEDNSVMLSCQFSGMAYPITTVRWKKDGKLLRDDGGDLHVDTSNGTLKIHSALPSDRGEYACVVNTTGFNPVQSKPAQLHIKGTTSFGNISIVFTHIPASFILQYFSTLGLILFYF